MKHFTGVDCFILGRGKGVNSLDALTHVVLIII